MSRTPPRRSHARTASPSPQAVNKLVICPAHSDLSGDQQHSRGFPEVANTCPNPWLIACRADYSHPMSSVGSPLEEPQRRSFPCPIKKKSVTHQQKTIFETAREYYLASQANVSSDSLPLCVPRRCWSQLGNTSENYGDIQCLVSSWFEQAVQSYKRLMVEFKFHYYPFKDEATAVWPEKATMFDM